MYFSRVALYTPRYSKFLTSLITSQSINNWVQAIRLTFVTTMNSYFEGFRKSLLQLHHSNILCKLLSTCSVTTFSDVPTDTSTVSFAYSMLLSLEHILVKSMENISKNSLMNPVLLPNLDFLYMTLLDRF